VSTQTYTVFDLVTRTPVRFVTCQESALPNYIREGQLAIAGRHLDMRLNDANEPEPDVAGAMIRERESRRNSRLAQIDAIERKMLRRVREILAAQDPMMKEFEDQVAAIRDSMRDL
jgi:hypothetical protein